MSKVYQIKPTRIVLVEGLQVTPEQSLATISVDCDLPIREVLALLQFRNAQLVELEESEIGDPSDYILGPSEYQPSDDDESDDDDDETLPEASANGSLPEASANGSLPEASADGSLPEASANGSLPEASANGSQEDDAVESPFTRYSLKVQKALTDAGILTLAQAAIYARDNGGTLEPLEAIGPKISQQILQQVTEAGFPIK